MLLMDSIEPLFLQAKESPPSVLDSAGRSRVVAGQHLQQAQSDIFLGWTRVADGVARDFYVASCGTGNSPCRSR